MADIDEAFDAFEAGDWAQAASICHALLAAEPDHFAAHYLLGTVAGAQKEWALARASLERASQIRPQAAAAYFNLATICRDMGDAPAALTAFSTCLDLRPDDVEALLGRAGLLLDAGEIDAARTDTSRAFELAPQMAATHVMRARVLSEERNYEAALAGFDDALAIEPDFVIAHSNRGGALMKLVRPEEARHAFETALQLDANDTAAHIGLSGAWCDLNEPEHALFHADQAIAINPQIAEAHLNRAAALNKLHRPHEAAQACDHALALKPKAANAHVTRALIHYEFHELDQAVAHLDQAIALDDTQSEAFFNRGLIKLLRHDFATGWSDYDHRLQVERQHRFSMGPQVPFIAHAKTHLTRDMVRGQRVIVMEEQGVGDSIMFASMLPDLIKEARQVVLVAQARLRGLFSASFPQLHIEPLETFTPEHIKDGDLFCFTGSLGHLYRRALSDFPRSPFLQPAPEKKALWRERLGTGETLIGLSWKGGTVNTNVTGRSLTLEDLLPVMADTTSRFICIQYGKVEEEVRAFEKAHGIAVRLIDPAQVEDLHDLAALISCLDHVVTVQNTNVHLCGALGIGCSTLIPATPEWRYGNQGSQMAWYGSVELFRRQHGASIAPLLQMIRTRLP